MFWRWTVIWLVLLLASGGYLAVRARGLWGRLKELGAELEQAQNRVGQLEQQLERLGERVASPDQLAVFEPPARARAARAELQAAARRKRRATRARHRPAWARTLH